MNESDKKKMNHLKQNCSVTDLEHMACEFYYDVTKELRRNLVNKWEEGACGKEKKLLEDILKVRCWKLDRNFSWTDNYQKQLLELNEKVMNGFSMAYKEAEAQFYILRGKTENNDTYLKSFNLDIKLKPFILEPNENEYYLEERGKGIYYLLYNMLPDGLWEDSMSFGRNLHITRSLMYEDNKENFSNYLGEGEFDDNFICWAMYDLFDNCKNILSWYDILKINEIRVEVIVTHQHFIENIGKGTFWDEGIQSLSDNEAENIRQEYQSRLSKDMSGLPVEIVVDEMNCWEKMGPFRRIKFHRNKKDKIDFKKLYSMSIEENPHVLVKGAQIDLTDEELQQVKDYVSKNRNLLIRMAKGKFCLLDYTEKLGYITRRRKR
jgi:hypothetical protein